MDAPIDHATQGFFGDVWSSVKKKGAFIAGRGIQKWAGTKTITTLEMSITNAFNAAADTWKAVQKHIRSAQDLAVHEDADPDTFKLRLNEIEGHFSDYKKGSSKAPDTYLNAAKRVIKDKGLINTLEKKVKAAENAFQGSDGVFSEDRRSKLVASHNASHPVSTP